SSLSSRRETAQTRPNTSWSTSPMYWASAAASAGTRACGRAASFTPGLADQGDPFERTGGSGSLPPPWRSGGGLDLPVFLEDPALDPVDRLGLAVDGAEVVEEAPFRRSPQRARREGHEDLGLGTPPQREADQPSPGQWPFREVDLGLAHEALGTVLTLYDLHLHRFPPRDSMSRMRR